MEEDVFDRLDHSMGEFIFLGTYNDMYRNPILTFAEKINSSSSHNLGQPLGYAIINFEQSALMNIFRNIKIEDSGYFFLLDSSGKALEHDNKQLTEALIKDENLNETLLKDRSGLLTNSYNNQKYMYFYNETVTFPFKIVGVVPINEIQKRVLPLIWHGAVYFLIYSLLIVVVATIISSLISKPLIKLKGLMKELQNENFQVRAEYIGRDEVAILYKQFNTMTTRLRELIFENYQSKLREKELQFLEKEAQFNALQQQINPHFLYNTLESIKWMAYKKGATEICDMVSALGKFFRGSITQGSDFVTVEEELAHLEYYFQIQKIRYRDKFDIIWDIDPEIRSVQIIKLIVQPIIENAINHGLDAMVCDGFIYIKGYKNADKMFIEIVDNGGGMSPEQLDTIQQIWGESTYDKHNSIALLNVYRRLELYFENRFIFEMDSRLGQGTIVRIGVPISTILTNTNLPHTSQNHHTAY